MLLLLFVLGGGAKLHTLGLLIRNYSKFMIACLPVCLELRGWVQLFTVGVGYSCGGGYSGVVVRFEELRGGCGQLSC